MGQGWMNLENSRLRERSQLLKRRNCMRPPPCGISRELNGDWQ